MSKDKLKQFTFKGVITGTSNKQSEDFQNDNPRKSCYIKVDKQNEKILLENGLTKYTSKEDKQDFFIIKLSETVTIWEGKFPKEVDCDIYSDNFSTKDKVIQFACIKGEHMKNKYVRIYALGVKSFSDIVVNEKENPFEQIEGFHPTDEDIPF